MVTTESVYYAGYHIIANNAVNYLKYMYEGAQGGYRSTAAEEE